MKDADQRPRMKEMIKRNAIERPNETRRNLACDTLLAFEKSSGEDFIGPKLSMSTLETLVTNTRESERGTWHTAIMMPPLLTMTPEIGSDHFLQFNIQQNIQQKDGTTKMSQMIGWANPALKLVAHQKDINLFIDLTFAVCPFPCICD